MRIVDGQHRVCAAQRKGLHEIDAYLFDGPEESAFIVAVQENVVHGLPLSLVDRKAAAARILITHAHWSDRAIATTTGLSAKTIAVIRRATEQNQQLHNRLGKDGRIRPLDTAAGRRLAAELIQSRPDASLREIAQACGISASTVRDVRARLRRGQDPIPASNADQHRLPAPSTEKHPAVHRSRSKSSSRSNPVNAPKPAEVDSILHVLSKDPALRMNVAGRELLRWLHYHAVTSTDSEKLPDFVPAHCLDHLVGLARRCSANWAFIAENWTRQSNNKRAVQLETSSETWDPRADRCG
jgi:uncharacterized protein YerC